MNKQTYAEATKSAPPNKLVKNALYYVKNKDSALDIGAGSLRDSHFLAASGFQSVTAIDKEEQDPDNKEIDFIHASIQDFDFTADTYDLVVAVNSLPFLSDADFDAVFSKITESLKKDGVLCITLFGVNDKWNNPKKKERMNFHSKEEVLSLLKNFSEIKTFIEEEREGLTINKERKQWHLFRIIAVK